MVSKSRWGNKNWRMTSRGLDMLSVLRCYLRLGLWHVAAVEVAIQLGQEFCFQVDRRPDTTCLGLGERETLTVTSHNPVQYTGDDKSKQADHTKYSHCGRKAAGEGLRAFLNHRHWPPSQKSTPAGQELTFSLLGCFRLLTN
ncbi:hypothetical protein MGG_16246 [Pyricularia oryzae 70-15]|uniref:Uncharacterized protein n=1 Tax=Pyricularia oryzae (strain 70-15 / ATCC MYA-4617 / FGSC 8958) TaxID=242507 RepID=G4MPR6_PYRO7|nr:uncharacterized protein MGG_16246 [Pyricularia oryzae 70-15]EHA57213.1 hypothetical protein MGG_16246 [Pyricularia oryzae 70-15]